MPVDASAAEGGAGYTTGGGSGSGSLQHGEDAMAAEQRDAVMRDITGSTFIADAVGPSAVVCLPLPVEGLEDGGVQPGSALAAVAAVEAPPTVPPSPPASSAASSWFVFLSPVLFVLIWATGFLAARFGMPFSPPSCFLGLRFALSSAVFAVWVKLARVPLPAFRPHMLHLMVTGVLVHFGYLGGTWAAIRLGMGAGLSSLITGLQPVITAVWLAAVNKSCIPLRHWIGLALGLGGLVAVVWGKLGHGEVTPLSVVYSCLSLASITVGTLYQKKYVAACDVRAANLVQLTTAAIVTAPIAAVEGSTKDIAWHTADGGVNGQLLGALAWSVLGLSLGGSSLLFVLLQRNAATRVTLLMFLVPPVTALLAWAIFGEALTALTGGGIVVTVLGVALVGRSPTKKGPTQNCLHRLRCCTRKQQPQTAAQQDDTSSVAKEGSAAVSLPSPPVTPSLLSSPSSQ